MPPIGHASRWRRSRGCPHQADTFKLSTDPLFIEKVVDVVGLYHSPPQRAVVLCVDEKSQIQALDRSQPVLPTMPGMPERRTHADGSVIDEPHRQHRATEFKRFLTPSTRPNWTCIWSAATTAPTRPRSCGPGSPDTPASTSTCGLWPCRAVAWWRRCQRCRRIAAAGSTAGQCGELVRT